MSRISLRIVASFLAASTGCFAFGSYNILNNVIGPTSNLISRPNFGLIQVSGAWQPEFNATVVEQFSVAAPASVTSVGFAWEGANGQDALAIAHMTGVQISIWGSLQQAASTNMSLTGNALYTVQVGTQNLSHTSLTGANTNSGTAVQTDITGLNFSLGGPGTYWIGVAVLLDYPTYEMVNILSNTAVAGNSAGINPGDGWGFGVITPGPPVSAAYGIGGEVAPEPCTLVAVGSSVLLLRRRSARKSR